MTPTQVLGSLGTGGHRARTGAVLVAVEAILAWRIGWSAALAAFLYLGVVGTVVSAVDLRTQRLPDVVVLPSYPVTLALLALPAGVGDRWWPFGRGLIAMVLVVAFYLVLGLVFDGGLGLGDAKLAGLVALGLGWLGWSVLVTGVLAGWLLAALALLARRVTRPASAGQPVAFGPWLCLGALVAIIVR